MLKEIKMEFDEKFKDHPNIFKDELESFDLDLQEWEDMNEPYVWESIHIIILEGGKCIELYSDSGYGLMAILEDDKIVSFGKEVIFSSDKKYVALDQYYGFFTPVLFRQISDNFNFGD